jgi:hypothetical protein
METDSLLNSAVPMPGTGTTVRNRSGILKSGVNVLADGEWTRFFSPHHGAKCVTVTESPEGRLTFYRYRPSILSGVAAFLCLLGVIATMAAYGFFAVSSYSSKQPLGFANRAVTPGDGAMIGFVLGSTLGLYCYLLWRNFFACSIPSFLVWGNIVPFSGFGILYAYMNYIKKNS